MWTALLDPSVHLLNNAKIAIILSNVGPEPRVVPASIYPLLRANMKEMFVF